ncbi:MAG: YceD family protein [Candidatus Rokuibacteriota bacterium]
MNDFQLSIARLPEGPSRVVLEAGADGAGLGVGEWVRPLALDLRADKLGEQVTLRGRLTGEVRSECARCLEPFSVPVHTEFAALAERGGRYAEGAEGSSGEDYVLAHDGRTIDLADAVREQVLLALPIVLVCRPDCAGLCLRCGVNRNAVNCSCGTEAAG